MAAEKDSLLSISKLDDDYEHWAMLMENLLRSKEWWSLVETGTEELAGGEVLQEMKLKDLKVKNYLFQAINKATLKTILQKDTAKQIWDSLKTRYQGNERVRNAQLQTLRRDFEVLEMKLGESVIDYFSRVMIIANSMRNLGEDLDDCKIVEKILRSLSEKYNYIVCSIEESKNIKNLSVDELQSSLLVHEQKFRRHYSRAEQALKVTHAEGSNMRGRETSRGGRGRGRGRQTYNKATHECYSCHQLGHH